jgi:multisubunit Na+/H+ antiporter MnhG subunit
MEKLVFDRGNLKKFGVTMGIAFLVIAMVILFRQRHSPAVFFIVSAIFFACGIILPQILKPFYIFWMRLAFVLSWVNTRLLLVLLFYLIFTPVGLCMRLLHLDPLERKIEKNAESYWRKKEKQADYERQF